MKYNIGAVTKPCLPHIHNNYEIIIYTSGSGHFYCEGHTFAMSSGKIIIVPPGTTHNSDSEGGERIYVNGDFSHLFNLSRPVILSDTHDKTGTVLARIIYDNRYSNEEYITALCSALGHFLLQNLKADSRIGSVIKEISNEIIENFHDCDINLHDILEKSGYAIDYIRAEFKSLIGKTPVEFLTAVRIDHARFLIDMYKNALSLSEIAEKCGYTDYIYFSRKFRQITGSSPTVYKKSLR